MSLSSIRRSFLLKLLNLSFVAIFVITMVMSPGPSLAQTLVEGLPQPGAMVNLSPAYTPLMITGLSVHPENPLLMDFIVNTGNSGLDAGQVKEQSSRLIKYFLACLTIPENNQWVNLSPYEKQHIIPGDLGRTVLGQDMLAQDYLLKQLTASLIYPEKNLGKDFWDRVYAKAGKMYGTTQIPMNTFNKVWILPDTAKVYTHNNTAFVVKSHLTVMLDEDYLALTKHQSQPGDMALAVSPGTVNPQPANTLAANIIRQIILPAIEQEVNQGRNFAQMRQIYNSMILAVWFKKNLKEALLNQVYADRSKVSGVNTDNPVVTQQIYQQYIEAYKKGVFNYIKEELDPGTRETIARKYFSGGLTPVARVDKASFDEAMVSISAVQGDSYLVSGLTQEARTDAAMNGRPDAILEDILSSKLVQIKHKIVGAVLAYNTAKAAAARVGADNSAGEKDVLKARMAEMEGKINPVVDQLNVYGRSKPQDLILSDDIDLLKGFLSSKDADVYRQFAVNYLLNGQYVPQFIFAGAATRLNRGPMYGLDIWDIAVEIGKAKVQEAGSHLGMGPRQLMAYRMALERLAGEKGRSPRIVLSNQKIIININSDIEKIVLDDFIKNNYYGFKPENVYFVTQPTFRGFKYDPSGNLEFDPQSPTVPYGHGHNFMQLGERAQAFTLKTDGGRDYLKGALLDQFPDDAIIGSHRINDLTKLSSGSVISIDKIAYAIFKIKQQGFDMVAELVENPNKQKGGNVLKDVTTGRSFLIETSNVKGSPELVKLLDEAGRVGAPYNAFRLVYSAGALKRILKNELPFNLRFKDGYFYLEAVTGDVTQLPAVKAAFYNSGEQIHDFKEPKNVDDALNYLRKSDEELSLSDRGSDKAMVLMTLSERVRMLFHDAQGQEFSLSATRIGIFQSLDIQEAAKLKALRSIRERAFISGNQKGRFLRIAVSSPAEGEIMDEAVKVKRIRARRYPAKDAYAVGKAVEFIIWLDQKIEAEGEMLSGVDKAALAEPGGIDLNASHLRMQSEGQKVDIAFDPAMIAQFKRGDFSGVMIQILDVVPVNLVPLLGFRQHS